MWKSTSVFGRCRSVSGHSLQASCCLFYICATSVVAVMVPGQTSETDLVEGFFSQDDELLLPPSALSQRGSLRSRTSKNKPPEMSGSSLLIAGRPTAQEPSPHTDELFPPPPWALKGTRVPFSNQANMLNARLAKNETTNQTQYQQGSVNARKRLAELNETDVPPGMNGTVTKSVSRPATMGEATSATMNKLLSNYHAGQAPPLNKNGKVPVAFAFRGNQLLEFDHVKQTLQIMGWVRMYWWDPRLEYEGSPALKGAASHQGWDSDKDFLTVESEKIWKPDITLYNAVDVNWGELCAPSKAFIADRKGGLAKTEEDIPMRWNVFWSQPCVLHSRCAAQLKYYPFDNNTCGLTFSPFADNFVEMHVATDMIDSAISVPEFAVSVNVNDTTIQKDPYTIVGKPVPWEVVTIRIRLLRHGQYYVINYIGPILLLIMLTWVGFWIPLQTSDRVAFNITLLLTLMAVNFITADKRPATHEDMWLDRFQTTTMLLVVGATFYSVFAYHMQPSDDWPEEKKKSQLSTLGFREKIARVVFPVIGGSYLGYLFWQLHNGTQEEDYSMTAYLIFVVLGVVAIGLCVSACTAQDVIEQLRGGEEDQGANEDS